LEFSIKILIFAALEVHVAYITKIKWGAIST